MIADARANRPWTCFLAVAVLAVWVCFSPAARGAVEGRELIVALQVPANASAEQLRQAADAQIAKAASCGADGVTLSVSGEGDPAVARIGDLGAQAAKRGLRLWIAVQLPNPAATAFARTLAGLPVEGLAVCFAVPQGEAVEPAKRGELLAVKQRGDELAQDIRQLKRLLGPSRRLALCTAMSETAPETARSRYVPVGDLVRDGTLDVVAVSEAGRANFHRLRLLRDAPLRAGVFLDARSVEENRRAGQLRRTVLEGLQNDTCQLVWLGHFPLDVTGQVVPSAVAGHKQSQQRQAGVEAALAKGKWVVDQEVSEKEGKDQASLHGVAQSFVPSRDGACPLVQVYAAIRGSQGLLPPPMHLDIRSDDNGRPGKAVLAQADIPAAEFGLEPAYRWGSALLEPPTPLKKGQAYWICLTNQSHPDGTYVWRLAKDGASPRGHAWSRKYDYTKHAWVFRVYLQREPSK